MRAALSGLLAGFALVAALQFLSFARRSGDRFFDYFAAAFALLAVNSFLLGITGTDAEGHVGIYILRLAAFATIVVAIVRKNRE